MNPDDIHHTSARITDHDPNDPRTPGFGNLMDGRIRVNIRRLDRDGHVAGGIGTYLYVFSDSEVAVEKALANKVAQGFTEGTYVAEWYSPRGNYTRPHLYVFNVEQVALYKVTVGNAIA